MPTIEIDYEIVNGCLHINNIEYILSSLKKEHMDNIPSADLSKENVIQTKNTSSSKRTTSKKVRQLSARQAAIRDLELEFARLTRLPLPRRNTVGQKKASAKMWWSHLGELWELCEKDTSKALRVMCDTIEQMQSNTPPLTIIAPSSIINIARTKVIDSARSLEVW